MAQLNFDARQIPPQAAFEPVPSGWQHMAIKDSELKPTKDNTGVMLVLTLVVLDGPFAGRQMFDRLNLQNPSPQAAEIGQRRLSAYCHATGVMQVADSGQLHGIPMNVKLGVRIDATGQYEPTNEVKAVKHITEPTDGSAHAQTSAPQTPAVATPQAPAGATPPWSQQAKFVQASAPAAALAPAQTPPWAQQAQAQPQPQPMLQQPAQSPPWAQPAQTVQTAQAQNTQQPTQPAGSFPPAAAPPMGATPPWAQPPVAQPMQPVQAAPAQTPPWAQPQQPPVAQQFVQQQQQPQQFTQTPPWAQPQR